ncbi:MAG TPA: NAD(P)H-dependent oxidoreductase subunit E [Candidatus Omnitrophota bacterium]|nr:NAD(P)H-dependent oxidoreductase subunit E [Candidatus Omnitrophota bacterium]
MQTIGLPVKDDIKKRLRKLGAFIDKEAKGEDREGALMGALHQVQAEFGYISEEAMDFISRKLSVPTAHIYGMATFYNYFSLKPKARYQIQVCKGTACYVGGGARILSKLKKELGIEEGESTPDGLFGLGITRCLGCCGLSPVMQVNDETHVRMVPEKIPAILKKCRRAAEGKKSRGKKK